MLANFKKFGVAAAVAAALGASGAANALVLGTPGDALLIPFVQANGLGSDRNTMISIVNASSAYVNVSSFDTLNQVTPKNCEGTLHWFFFDANSVEIVNNFIPVTCEDWVGIDFAYEIQKAPSAVGVPGYLVVTDAAANGAAGSSKILYGSAWQIRGNWATQAFIPVLPMIDLPDGTVGDEVVHAGPNALDNVNPVTAGMQLAHHRDVAAWFSLRYYLGDNPQGTTTFVLWFPENSGARNNNTIYVYDAEEQSASAQVSYPSELNILTVGADGDIKDWLANEGYVLFDVDDSTAPDSAPVSRGGVAFSLIGVAGANAVQIQTELAHERGVK
jgi:hypothetical protein